MTWRAIAVLLLVAATSIRLFRIEEHNIWWDEGFGVAMARMPLGEMALRTAADVHPPVYYALLKLWARAAGESAFALRYGSALLGIVDLALLFALARRYAGGRVALLATALLTINRFHVEWSQEIRMYTLAIALALISTICFLRIYVDGDRRPRWWVGHLATSAVGLHTLYFFGLTPLVQTLLVLAWRRSVVRWVGVQGIAVALFAPWALLFLSQPRPTPPPIFPVDLVTWLRAVLTTLPVGISAYLDDWWAVTIGATALAILPLVSRPVRGRVLAALYLPLAIAPVAIYLLSYPNPLFAAVSIGTLFDLSGARWLRDDYHSLASFVRSYARPGDAVILYSDWDWPVWDYHAGPTLPRYGVGTQARQTATSAASLATGWLERHDSLWLVTVADAYDVDPEGHVRRELEGRARSAADLRVGDRRLTLFTRDPGRTTASPVPTPAGARAPILAGRPALVATDLPVRELRAGEQLHLATYWTGPGDADAARRFEIVDRRGAVQRRQSSALRDDWPAAAWPAGQVVRADDDLSFDPGLAPGLYDVRLGRPAGAAVSIGRILVRPPERAPPMPLAPPSPPLPSRADRFGGEIELVGVEVPEPPRAGSRASVRLLWQSIAATPNEYTAFLQVVGADQNPATGNRVWAQVDRPPAVDRSTRDWLPGELHIEERTLDLPPTTPPGQYDLIVGIYDSLTGARLRLPDGSDSARLATWMIRPA